MAMITMATLMLRMRMMLMMTRIARAQGADRRLGTVRDDERAPCSAVDSEKPLRIVASAIGPQSALTSASWISLSVRPFTSFHAIRPFSFRPSRTAAAVEGEANE